ncbi:DNA topoisomerase [Paenibacillus alkaliterrae]|uniref:DNA topoisomerase n=1 Tax=Paenibacillus alkaliterrae TaxID=320909 RepID=UPI001F4584F5|nr:DNA topoisomerase [Paenibacillus alkaliterrae]MCF2940319.1 DNA topoisomerase [Paenibacillus alkaliterrae]
MDSDGNGSGQGKADRQPAQLLPPLTLGQMLPVKQAKVRELRTLPPARYTEATLLTQMKKHSLGTPATRADIIEKLLGTDTMTRSQNRLMPTGKGKQLVELVVNAISRWKFATEKRANSRNASRAM